MTQTSIIQKLTPEQESLIPQIRDEWIQVGLQTGRMTPEQLEGVTRAVHGIYAAAGKPAPTVVVVPSPLTMALAGSIAWHILGAKDSVLGAVSDAVGGAVDGVVGAAVRGAVHDAVDGVVGGAVSGAVHDAVDDAVGGAVGAAVVDAVRGAVYDAVRDAVSRGMKDAPSWWKAYHGGNAWPGWDAYLTFFVELVLQDHPAIVKLRESYDCWRYLTRNSGFRFMGEGFCLVSEFPVTLHTEVDGRGRHVPHCEDGPTHLWADGFAIYHWHGVRVDRRIIEQPETITLDEIRSETNAELRRVLRERYGDGRYLVETGAKVIDSDHETCRKGAAPRLLIEDDQGQRFLVGTDGSTSRTYYMRVGDTITTCRAAHESLCGFSEDTIATKS